MATDNDDWADWNQPNQSSTSDDSWAQFDGSTPSSDINFGSADMFSQSSTAFGSFQSKTTLEDAGSTSPPKSSSQLDDQSHDIGHEAPSSTKESASFGGPTGDEDLASSSQPSETQSITTLDTDNGNPADPYDHPTEQYETASTAKIPRIVTKDPTFGDEDEEEEAYEDDDDDEFFKLKPLDVPAPTGDFQVSMGYQPEPEDESDITSPADSHHSILPNSDHSDHFDSSQTEHSERTATPMPPSSIDPSPSNIHDHGDLFATSPQTPNAAEISATSVPQESSTALDDSSAHAAAFVSSGNPADSPVFSNEVTSQNESGFANWISTSTQTSEGFADWGSPNTSSDAHDFAHFPDNSSTVTADTKLDDGFASFDAPTLSNPTSSTSTPIPQFLSEQGLESSQPTDTISEESVRTPSKEEPQSEASMEDAKSDESDPSSLENANPGSTASVETSIIEHSEPIQEALTEGEGEDKKPSQEIATTSSQESEVSITSNDNPIESRTELNGSITDLESSDHTENVPSDEQISLGYSHGTPSTSGTITEIDSQSSFGAVDNNNEESDASHDEVQSSTLQSSTTPDSEVPVATQAIDSQAEEFEPLEEQTPKQSTQASGFEDDFAEWSNSNADDGDLDAFADFDAQNGADDDDFDFPSTANNDVAVVPPQTHTPISSQTSSTQPSSTHSAGTVSQSAGTAHVPQGKPSVFVGSPNSVLEKVTSVLAPLNTLHLDLKADVSNTLLDTPSLESIAGTVMEQKWEAKDSKRAPKPVFRNTHFESEFLTAIGKQPLPTISPGLESFMKRTPSGKRASQQHNTSPAMVMAPLQPLSAKESASISAALGLTPTVVTQPPTVAMTLPSTPAGSSKTTAGSHLITPTQSENAASSNLLASPVDIPLAPVDLSMFGPPPTTNTAAPKIVHDDSSWMSAFMGTTSTTSKQTRGETTPAPLMATPSVLSKAGSTTPSDFSVNRSLQTPLSPSETPDRTSTPELSVLPLAPSPSVSPAPNVDSSIMTKSASSTLFSERLKRSGSSGGGFSRSSSGLFGGDTPPGAATPTVEFEEGDEIGPIVHSLLKAMPNLSFMHHASVVVPRRS